MLPPSGENSEHIRALQMIFAAESQLNHALVGSLEYISGGKPWNTHGIAKINSLTSRKKKSKNSGRSRQLLRGASYVRRSD